MNLNHAPQKGRLHHQFAITRGPARTALEVLQCACAVGSWGVISMNVIARKNCCGYSAFRHALCGKTFVLVLGIRFTAILLSHNSVHSLFQWEEHCKDNTYVEFHENKRSWMEI